MVATIKTAKSPCTHDPFFLLLLRILRFNDGRNFLGGQHAPFVIGPRERDAWLSQMRHAVDSLDLPADQHETLWNYLERAAFFMVNSLSE